MSEFLSYPRQDVFKTTLSTDIGAGDMTIAVNQAPSFSMTTGGANSFYIVIDPDMPSTKLEIVECDGINGSNLVVKTSGRGKPKYEGGASTAQSHTAGAKVYISDNWQTFKDIYTAIQSKLNAAGGTVTGPLNFSGASTTLTIPNLTTAEKNALTPANGMLVYDTTLGEFQVYDGGAWQSIGTSSVPNGSETVAGIYQLATNTQITNGDTTGSTGARLVAPNDTLKTNLEAKFPSKVDVQNSTYVYAADGGGTDAYAITLSPAPSAYATGQVFHFKANTINTGAATLNVNTLGAKTIKKNYNEDLGDGDLIVGQMYSVIYDGTNFQLISPIFNPNFYLGASSVTTSRNANVDVTITHSKGKKPRLVEFFPLLGASYAPNFGAYDGANYIGTAITLYFNPTSGTSYSTTTSALFTYYFNDQGTVNDAYTLTFTVNSMSTSAVVIRCNHTGESASATGAVVPFLIKLTF